ncbi:uncharacterized protein LOC118237764 [Cricetulus griseus]|uniref:Uncharacterized protein LOC118237764 n=1 Tax=Cricetulus griseus TaxID=10029 RepID=A0A9J7H678_CRIGR|nr:uncharacterized protein LOC118237764 [Cricetulus griseus]XP_035304639.1 uncharacterized protein LOC118237764 [Cricetulus griseus]XP_035304640.1 uncharacterized protein LOC118237764 [Cricetulus griseus]
MPAHSPLPRRRPSQARQEYWLSGVPACRRAWDSWKSQATGSPALLVLGDLGSRTCNSGGSRPGHEEESFRSAHAGLGLGLGWGSVARAPLCSPPPPASSPLLRRRAFLGRHLFATSSFLSRLAPERVNLFGLGSQLLSNLRRPSWAAPPHRRNPPSRPPGPRIHDTRACNLFKGVVESTFRKQPAHRRRGSSPVAFSPLGSLFACVVWERHSWRR